MYLIRQAQRNGVSIGLRGFENNRNGFDQSDNESDNDKGSDVTKSFQDKIVIDRRNVKFSTRG